MTTDASGSLHYVRNPSAAVITAGNRVLIVRAAGSTATLRVEHPILLSSVLHHLREPLGASELAARCGVDVAGVVTAMEPLLREQALLSAPMKVLSPLLKSPFPAPEERPCRRLVVGISGSVGAAVMLPVLLNLQAVFAEQVDVIVTESARRFLMTEALRYFGLSVWTDPFAARDDAPVPHMHLARAAELVLIMPTSARTIHKLATGECSDLLSLVVAATEAPVVIAPAMNERMHRFPAIQRNLHQLRADGIYVVEPAIVLAVNEAERAANISGGAGLTASTIVSALRAVLEDHHRG